MLRRIIPSMEQQGNLVRDLWDRLSTRPGGRWLFHRLIAFMVPYTGSLGARVVELRPGFGRTELRERRAVRNHLRSVHAIALANLAELTGNLVLQYSLPDDRRFIVTDIRLEYTKKARGTITGTCHCEVAQLVEGDERKSYDLEVRLSDASDETVATAVLTSLVGLKKRSASSRSRSAA